MNRPVPTKLKVLRGNPGHRSINKREPQPAAGTPTCPSHLDEVARREWRRLVKCLADCGLLTELERGPLSCYCLEYSRLVAAEAAIAEQGTVILTAKGYPILNPHLSVARGAIDRMHKLGGELGLSPVSRTRLSTERPAASDDDEFLGGQREKP